MSEIINHGVTRVINKREQPKAEKLKNIFAFVRQGTKGKERISMSQVEGQGFKSSEQRFELYRITFEKFGPNNGQDCVARITEISCFADDPLPLGLLRDGEIEGEKVSKEEVQEDFVETYLMNSEFLADVAKTNYLGNFEIYGREIVYSGHDNKKANTIKNHIGGLKDWKSNPEIEPVDPIAELFSMYQGRNNNYIHNEVEAEEQRYEKDGKSFIIRRAFDNFYDFKIEPGLNEKPIEGNIQGDIGAVLQDEKGFEKFAKNAIEGNFRKYIDTKKENLIISLPKLVYDAESGKIKPVFNRSSKNKTYKKVENRVLDR